MKKRIPRYICSCIHLQVLSPALCWSSIAVMLCCLGVVFTAAAVHADQAGKKNVLILNSYHKGLSWTDNVVRGVEEALRKEKKDIMLFYEYMDTKRYFDEAYLRRLNALYSDKYSKNRFDAVIVTDNNALKFVNRFHKTLFPGTPIVFCGINNYNPSMIDDKSMFTGTVEEIDIRNTLNIALRLHPEATTVVSINDSTTTGTAVKKEVLAVAPRYEGTVDFVFFEDFDIEELKERVWKLPRTAIILLSVVTRDKTGQFFAYEESLEHIYSESSVPIYSFWDTYLGKGIVGGMLISGYHQGQSAARLALRILNGEDVASIPVERESPNSYMFDYRQLKLFGIDEASLPEGSIIINQPDTLYSRYKTLFLTILFTITSLVIVIVALLTIISYRKRMERALRESEARYRDFYENAPDMFHSVNREGIIIDCNETEARMLGYRKNEIIGRPIADFFTEKTKKMYEKEFPLLKDKRVHLDVEREFVRKDGSTFTAGLNIYTEVDDHGDLIRTKTIARDLTERRRVEELKKSREQLRSLSAYLEGAREEEKKRIARQIHDELGHALTTLSLDLSWLRSRLAREGELLDRDTLLSRAQAMSELIDSTVQTVQRISSELLPGVLDHLGLAEAIKWQVDKFRTRTGISFGVIIDPEDIMLDQNDAITIFRIFQEAMTNIMRHSGATDVQVIMKELADRLELEVRDNGKGIHEDQIVNHESVGLIGMRERARILGGTVSITGSPGISTTVRVVIPLPREGVTR